MSPSLDVDDSTDWIGTSLPAFEPLEASLRCEICKGFYITPVITPCSHTFCSQCIRRCIASGGKCPICTSSCQADKLIPNIAVREIVGRFCDARPKALDLARVDKNSTETPASGKKRKLGDADIDDGEPVRQTRARLMRSRNRRGEGADDMPLVVPDSEDENDEDYLPDGMVRCPSCNQPMKEAQVFSHLDVCPGPGGPPQSSAGRNTRSKKTSAFTDALQRKKEPAPAPSRLAGLNYAMLSESALRKKLKELGIPTVGSKPLLIRRHQEWLNLWNSNCDAAESARKSKRELLRELDEWERTQGGQANSKESHIMRKDFDGQEHAMAYKSQFNDLIAAARKKRTTPAPKADEQKNDKSERPGQDTVDPARPYDGNESALSTIRNKVEEANGTESVFPPLDPGTSKASTMAAEAAEEAEPAPEPQGFQGQFASPTRKVPMFSLPEEPVVDVEHSNVQ